MLENYPRYAYETQNYVTVDSRSGTSSQSSASNILLGNDYRSGVINPGWERKIALGIDASSAYSRRGFTLVKPGAPVIASTQKVWSASWPYSIMSSGSFRPVGQPLIQFTTDTETRNSALGNIKKQLGERSGGKDMMSVLYELKSLRKDILGAIKTSTAFVKNVLSRVNQRNLKASYASLQDAWLTYSFNIAPIISDIEETKESIGKYLNRQDSTVRLSGSKTKRGMYSYTPGTSVSFVPFGCRWTAKGVAHYELSYRYIGAWDLLLEASNDYGAQNHWGLQLKDIPAALWEVTAFSWMADYFVNVGDFLEDAFYSPPGNTKYLVECVKYKADLEHTFETSIISGNLLTGKMGSTVSRFTYQSFTRTPLLALPHIGLTVKSFDSIAKGSLNKLLNLIALVKIR